MKKIILILVSFGVITLYAQDEILDSLKHSLSIGEADTAMARLFLAISNRYTILKNKDSSIVYAQEALKLSQKLKYLRGEIYSKNFIIGHLLSAGNSRVALEMASENLKMAYQHKISEIVFMSTFQIASGYEKMGDFKKYLEYAKQLRSLVLSGYLLGTRRADFYYDTLLRIELLGKAYGYINQLDSSLYSWKIYYGISENDTDSMSKPYSLSKASRNLADLYNKMGHIDSAFSFYRLAVMYAHKTKLPDLDAMAEFGIASLFHKTGQIDSAIAAALRSLTKFKNAQSLFEKIMKTDSLLSKLYEANQKFDSAYIYLHQSLLIKDSLFNRDKIMQVQNLSFNDVLYHQRLAQEKKESIQQYNFNLKLYGLIAGLIVMLLLALIFYRNSRQKQKAKRKIEKTYEELKTMQSQLVHLEKEKLQSFYHKELLELEAKALRSQMNPHFIFNSMNSIKSLINKNENDKAANYLTTLSKLIRTLFQNSDKREVSLYEELATCKLYTQLEKMRFGDKVEFLFDVDETIDLKDFKVPALFLQPFIENAIWHGLIPKETGGIVTIIVNKNDGAIQCIIDDNGIGRERSKQFKPQFEATYQSKGIGLTQSRLELDKLLSDREDAIFIIDKEDENGEPEGTKVVISFKENKN